MGRFECTGHWLGGKRARNPEHEHTLNKQTRGLLANFRRIVKQARALLPHPPRTLCNVPTALSKPAASSSLPVPRACPIFARSSRSIHSGTPPGPSARRTMGIGVTS